MVVRVIINGKVNSLIVESNANKRHIVAPRHIYFWCQFIGLKPNAITECRYATVRSGQVNSVSAVPWLRLPRRNWLLPVVIPTCRCEVTIAENDRESIGAA